MYHLKRRFVPAIAAGVIGLGAVVARAEQPSTQPANQQDLQVQVNDLKAQVANLQAKENQNQADVTAAIQQVLTDADQHSQLMSMDTSMVGGWDDNKKMFYLASEDGSTLFHPGIYFQERYVAAYRSSPHMWQEGFETRRSKFYFDGNLFSKDLTYKFQWQDATQGGGPTLEYAWAQYIVAHDVGPGDIGVKVGQYKDPVFKEQVTGDQVQPLVERSLLDSTLGGNANGGPLIKGADLVYTGTKSPIHGDFIFFSGDASGNTDFNNVIASGATDDFGLAAHADYKFFGDWADTADFTGKQSGKHDLLDVGGGLEWSQASATAAIQGTNALRGEIDAQYQSAGQWGAFGEVIGDTAGLRGGPAANHHSREDFGAMIEGTYNLNMSWQLAARYSYTDIDHNFKVGNKDSFNELGIGTNYFMGPDGMWGNHAKVTFDIDYLPNGTPAATGLDYLASPNNKDEIVFRSQFQLYF